MLPVTLTNEAHPVDADLHAVYDSIAQYNLAQVGDHWTGRLTIFARDDRQQLLGGIIGFTDRGWLRIELLGVLEPWRRQGIGAKLLEAAESEARQRGCHSAWVDTFSFQALPFYQQRGYAIFGQLERYPDAHTRYFLQKAFNHIYPMQTY
jgi:GNAT superfamily N-acetyltransferase